jgi:aminoglycoside 6'-N-acetyltransferase I
MPSTRRARISPSLAVAQLRMHVVPATAAHVAPWAELRAELWPDDDAADHQEEIEDILATSDPRLTAFVALDDGGALLGFAEASLRHDYVEGCDTSPVAYLEGICVRSEARQGGVARALADAVADWGRAHGCTEYASDAIVEDDESHRFHAAIGFAEVERVVCFRKEL